MGTDNSVLRCNGMVEVVSWMNLSYCLECFLLVLKEIKLKMVIITSLEM